MAITNLAQYYSSQGQSLPSISERAGLYSQFGLGSGYQGTAGQNSALLAKLMGGGGGGLPTGSVVSSGGGGGAPSPFGQLSAAQQALQQFYSQQTSPVDIYNQLSGQVGLTSAQDALNTTQRNLAENQTRLSKVKPNVQAQNQGFQVTQDQQDRMITSQQAPIAELLNELVNAQGVQQGQVGQAQQALQTLLGLWQQTQGQQEKGLLQQLADAKDLISLQQTKSSGGGGGSSSSSNSLKTVGGKSLNVTQGVLGDVNGLFTKLPGVASNPGSAKDKYLSVGEAKALLKQIKAKYNLDDQNAHALFSQVFDSYGWQMWEDLTKAQQQEVLRQQALG